MVDFLCPKCGSIDHLEMETVLFPRQCPGCDEFVVSASSESSGTRAVSQPKGQPVRMNLLRIDAAGPTMEREGALAGMKIWAGAAVIFVLLSAGAYAWFAWSGQVATTDLSAEEPAASTQSAVHAAQAESGEPPALETARAYAPAQGVTDPAVSREPASPAGRPEQSTTTGARGDAPLHLSEPVGPAVDRPAPLSSPTPISSGRISLATPLYGRVPMLTTPSSSGREIQELSGVDMLLVLDTKPLHSWLHVMEIRSGAEGWVRENQVRIGPNSE